MDKHDIKRVTLQFTNFFHSLVITCVYIEDGGGDKRVEINGGSLKLPQLLQTSCHYATWVGGL